jgi:hypothetical protein
LEDFERENLTKPIDEIAPFAVPLLSLQRLIANFEERGT